MLLVATSARADLAQVPQTSAGHVGLRATWDVAIETVAWGNAEGWFLSDDAIMK